MHQVEMNICFGFLQRYSNLRISEFTHTSQFLWGIWATNTMGLRIAYKLGRKRKVKINTKDFIYFIEMNTEKQQATSSIRKLKVSVHFGLTLTGKIWEAIPLTKSEHWIQQWRTHGEIRKFNGLSWEKDASALGTLVMIFPTLYLLGGKKLMAKITCWFFAGIVVCGLG